MERNDKPYNKHRLFSNAALRVFIGKFGGCLLFASILALLLFAWILPADRTDAYFHDVYVPQSVVFKYGGDLPVIDAQTEDLEPAAAPASSESLTQSAAETDDKTPQEDIREGQDDSAPQDGESSAAGSGDELTANQNGPTDDEQGGDGACPTEADKAQNE